MRLLSLVGIAALASAAATGDSSSSSSECSSASSQGDAEGGGGGLDPFAVVGGGAPEVPFVPLLGNKGALVVPAEPEALPHAGGPGAAPQTPQDIAAAAVQYLSAAHGVPADQLRVTNAYTDAASGMTHVYVVQHAGGVDVANAVANVNVSPDGKVVSSSQSFAAAADVDAAAQKQASLVGSAGGSGGALAEARQALAVLAAHLGTPLSAAEQSAVGAAAEADGQSFVADGGQPGVALDGVPERVAVSGAAAASRALVQLADGQLAAAWRVNVEQRDHWWNALVDVGSGRVAALADWYAGAAESYYVFPRSVNTPTDGARQLVAAPASHAASPKGWTAEGATAGNNVWAQSNPRGGSDWRYNHRAQAQANGTFYAPLDLRQAPAAYVDAAITQLFYTVNVMHDLAFAYGFDEAAGNFQEVNYSGQGAGGDAVIANAQDGGGTNNANFATPPDGQRPRMRMYVWTYTQPSRDGDLEQDIVAHEYTHGISNRLTGGPANSDCLVAGEAGGMGEGWSDAVANILRLRATDTNATRLTMGAYVAGRGIRTHAYSTSLAVNPLTYAYLDRADYQEVHAVGEVWAAMLYEVTWALIGRNGFAADLMAHDVGRGNALALQLLLDGMKLQPCNPSFVDARNAILQAESRLTGGANKCAIWRAFAKRGLGPRATGGNGRRHVEDYSVPSGC
ncbi:hypothetical protein IWQ57_001994 [Coemansia nantahalensis]|uniref:Uncharacterized protein n=1 Tax=Coemansia nantahalensis TaxID=2789366 RepID=A0ACC1K1X4_9FUNG|nr:hypothetical protein IWQ57_001994 [Coemansia nantahalensis]